MGTSGSAPDATREDTWSVFSQLDEPHTPLTTAEVADKLECTDRAAQHNLEALAELGELRSRRIDQPNRIWWRSDGGDELVEHRSELEEFGAFVSDVEDYAIFMLDPDGTVVSWNEGAERIKGYSEDEITGEHFSTFYTEDDIDDGVPEYNLETAAERGRAEDEGWRIREDGSRFWADVVITAIRDDDGELRGFTKVTRDMTDRREYERQLRRERDLTERVLETVPVSIAVVAPDGGFVQANERTLDRLGVTEAELTDSNVDSLDIYDADGDPIPTDERPWKRVHETGEPVTDYQCQIDLPDIGRRWLSINTAPLADTQQDDRIVVTVDDVTDQKDRERQLRRERDQTEQLLRTVPVGIAVQNADRETVRANERAQETFGIPERKFREDPVDTGEWRIYDAEGEPLDPDETPSARALASEEPVFDEELVIEQPDGERLHFTVNAAPLFGPDGDVERVVTAGEDITDIKARERRLKRRKTELETELSDIFDRISDAFYALDDEWRLTHLNERTAEMWGRSRDELLGKPIRELLPDGAEDAYVERFRTAMETQEPVTFERYNDGLDAWLEFNVYPSESGLSIYFRDVTERKERERELERTERRFEAIFEDPNILVGLLEPDGTVLDINQTAMEYIDADLEAVTGEPFWETPWWGMGDDVQADVKRWTERAIAGEYVDFEADLTRPDGQRYALEGVFRPVTNDDGDVVSVVVSDRDVSERREYERELAESERRYRALAENFPNGLVALFDPDFEYTLAAGQGFDAIPVDPEQAEGKRFSEVWDDDAAEALEPLFRAALDGEKRSIELAYAGRDWVVHAVPITDEGGDVFAGMTMAQDITERKQREQRLEELIGRLEQSNERLEQFAYAASHDLQEPLRMVSSYLQLLETRYGDELDEDAREFIDFAVDGADRMREMIEGLLEYSRVETRGDPFESVDLDAVLADVRDDLQVRIEETDAELTADELPRVEGDRRQLRQVFQNLLDNGIEYSGDDPPRVHVSAERNGDWWEISVRDEGIGIDPDDADRAFEVFQSLHAPDDHSGTGIGLALCERIVERHGGDIWIDSEPGEGSAFTFTLPVE